MSKNEIDREFKIGIIAVIATALIGVAIVAPLVYIVYTHLRWVP